MVCCLISVDMYVMRGVGLGVCCVFLMLVVCCRVLFAVECELAAVCCMLTVDW